MGSTFDIDAAYPLPPPDPRARTVRQLLIDRADVAARLALAAPGPLNRHYYLGLSRGYREALDLEAGHGA